MRHGSLCSGYGGLDLALLSVLGGSIAWHVENDEHPSSVLDARFPGVPNYGDVKTTDWTAVEPVEWLTAGYPCQPFSSAGLRLGETDERHLWPHVADAIRVLRPRRVLLENVAGHLSLGFGTVIGDLASLGYDTSWVCLRASDAGAPHGRERVFLAAADTRSGGRREKDPRGRDLVREGGLQAGRAEGASSPGPDRPPAADTQREGLEGPTRTGLGRASEPAPSGGTATDPDGDGRAWLKGLSAEWGALHEDGGGDVDGRGAVVEWGAYAAAIARWEGILGRPSPRPTEPGRRGRERLSPRFVEWLMGLPTGWVTDVPIPRNAQLKALGNGVVPQQAALALRLLLPRLSEAAA